MLRRDFVYVGLAAPFIARAANWPVGPVRVICTYTPGGANDFLGRFAANALTQRFGVPFVVENRPGAGGNLGLEIVARAAPDGQTLGVAAGSIAVNQTLYRNMPFDALRDFAPVTLLGVVPNVLAVHPAVPARDLAAFGAWARAQPGGVTYASAGIGAVPHLAMALLLRALGAEGVHVPFRGSAPAITEVVAGRIPAVFENLPPLAEQMRAGGVRALAISTLERQPDFPELPTVAETLPGFEVIGWQSLVAPGGTPPAVLEDIAGCVRDAVTSAAGRTSLGRFGALPRPTTPAEFGAFLAAEVAKWALAVRVSGAVVE